LTDAGDVGENVIQRGAEVGTCETFVTKLATGNDFLISRMARYSDESMNAERMTE
jgi:hypothetical protein